MKAFRTILVPTDFGESAKLAEQYAIDFAAKFDARLVLLHVHTPPVMYSDNIRDEFWPYDELARQAEGALERALEDLKSRYPRAEGRFATGSAWQEILSTAKDRRADLIVMGTHGRRGLPRALLGSVAEKIVRLSPVPVLTVRQPE